MRRMSKKSVITIIILLPFVILGYLYTQQARFFPSTEKSLKVSQDFPDPTALLYQGTYYAYSTVAKTPDGKVINSPSAFGTNLEALNFSGDAISTLPSWVLTARHPIAPDVFNDGKQFVMYSSLFNKNTGMYDVAVGLSSSPKGPFTFHEEPVIASTKYNSFDASYFKASEGKAYLAYATDKANAAEIHIIAVNPETFAAVGTAETILTQKMVTNPKNNGKGTTVTRVEAPQIVQAPDGSYVLFFSANDADRENYFTGYATSNSLRGPYHYQGALMTTASVSSQVLGPGGMSVISGTTSADEIVFHGFEKNEKIDRTTARELYTATLTWSNGNVPSVQSISQPKLVAKEKVIPTAARAKFVRELTFWTIIWLMIVALILTRKLWRPLIGRLFGQESTDKASQTEKKKLSALTKTQKSAAQPVSVLSTDNAKNEIATKKRADNKKEIKPAVAPTKSTQTAKPVPKPVPKPAPKPNAKSVVKSASKIDAKPTPPKPTVNPSQTGTIVSKQSRKFDSADFLSQLEKLQERADKAASDKDKKKKD